MIEPTVGRKVWYRPEGADPAAQPHDATVLFVHDARTVNLACCSDIGTYYHRLNVPLMQGDETALPSTGYAEWMPYQKGQAVKTEQAQAAAVPGAALDLSPI